MKFMIRSQAALAWFFSLSLPLSSTPLHSLDNPSPFEFGSSVTSIKTTSPSRAASGPNVIADNTLTPSLNQLVVEEPLPSKNPEETAKTVLINFNNVSMVEYVRFVSRISNRNFIFDENDLQFNVTIVSEEPATIENVMTALMQELMIHNLTLIEDNNNLIIHNNSKVNGLSNVIPEGQEGNLPPRADIVTQVFRLNTLDPEKAAALLKPLTSDTALIEPLKDTNHLIVTDIASNIKKMGDLLKSIDAPNSGVVIGQYVSVITSIDVLVPLIQQIVTPISQEQPITFVPHQGTNSIFIVGSPFLVERAIAILHYLDQEQGATRILNLKDLQMQNIGGKGATTGQKAPGGPAVPVEGEWYQGPDGNWYLKPKEGQKQDTPPKGRWVRDANGNWQFIPDENGEPGGGTTGPRGKWTQDADGNWVFQLNPDEALAAPPLGRQYEGTAKLPGGVEKENQFYIYKLQYRLGESVEPALRQVADTLQQNEKGNQDLISTLRSVQWLSTPNSLVFSGTQSSIEKARALAMEFDQPMRQVFIEMLIMETTLDDSLEFGVTYATRFGGGDTSGGQTFFGGDNPLANVISNAGISNLGQQIGTQGILVPDGTRYTQSSGLNLAVIGQKITHCGTEFGSIAALIKALHDRTKDEVISNPKLLVEDNAPAEIFVGINTPYRTQSIANDFGSVITSNYEYRDVGTRLKVTPYLGNGDIIALDIEEEVSSIVAGLITNADTAASSPGPTTRINRTSTRVHIPDNYFLIISGMMQDEESRERNQIPCLGGVPVIGAAFSQKINKSAKRNLMIFIRPKIIDTEDEVQYITRHQQDIYTYKNCLQNSDEYETVEGLDLLNLKKTLHPEDVYDCECECE